MKLKHKILLQFVLLIALVSSAIIFTTAKLSEEGKRDVFDGVSSKLRELQKISTSELGYSPKENRKKPVFFSSVTITSTDLIG